MILHYDFNDDSYDYEIDDDKAMAVVVDYLIADLHLNKEQSSGAAAIFNSLYNSDALDAELLLEVFEDEITSDFESEAYEEYKENKTYESEVDSWFGTKRDILGR